MKKLEKLRIISEPRQEILKETDLFQLMGTDNCNSYVNCHVENKNSCGPIYNDASCSDPGATMKCEGGYAW
ncbi:MAG: hypothetical protein E7099_00820 [Mediterranea massiliensis]|nr:hypothetical protein [Mediterranea massiliensis]